MLFATAEAPELLRKPFDSVVEKSFRKNVVANRNWPDAPDSGWITPENWFYELNDIVRTMLVVKYLDGVRFLMNKIAELCTVFKFKYHGDMEARDEGYYAGHSYFITEYELPTKNWQTRRDAVRVEVQVTTQLQDVIRRLSHRHYANRRLEFEPNPVKWQWRYDDPEFTPNYLGHILHYVEGMIMEVRNREGQP